MTNLFSNLNKHMLQDNSFALLISIILVLFINFILRKIFQRFHIQQNIKKLNIPKLQLLMDAIGKPIRVYLWLLILFYAIYFVAIDIFALGYHVWFSRMIEFSTLMILLWVGFRFIKRLEGLYIRKLPVATQTNSFEISGIKAFSRLAQVGLLLIFTVIVLGIFAIPISGLVTVGGVGGIAIAYAGKDILSNFLGGLMIYLNRQFAIGDTVRSPDRDIAGTIERMDWRYTTIRRADKQTMYVPNSLFSGIILINTTRINYRNIVQNFKLRLNDLDKIPAIFKDIRSYLEHDAQVEQSQTIQINIADLTNAAISFTVSFYTPVVSSNAFYEIQDKVLLKIGEIVKSHDAAFMYPTVTLDSTMI